MTKKNSATQKLINYNKRQIEFLYGRQNRLIMEKKYWYARLYYYYIWHEQWRLNGAVAYPSSFSTSQGERVTEAEAESMNAKTLRRYYAIK